MSIDLPLAQMSLAEKLAAMEALWADLSKHSREAVSPDWHLELVAARKRMADQGKLKFENLDDVMSELRMPNPILLGESPTDIRSPSRFPRAQYGGWTGEFNWLPVFRVCDP